MEEDREHQILLLLGHAVHLGWNIKHDDEGIYFHKTAPNGLELGVHFDAVHEQESVEEFLDAIYEYGNEYSVAEELSYYANVEHYGQGLVLDDVIDDLKWFKDEVLEVHTFLENYHQELSQKENETIEMELEEIDKEL
ncbi:hypothetical protein MKC98_19450 [[Clostridium] innocuum]|nr:hypothetical protein [[Clostridium] innocuum]MCR0599589.1 hypothetical protein [[Clostridium] innocuum]